MNTLSPLYNPGSSFPYHPASEGYKNILRDDENSAVVTLGPGSRGLNPFYAFPNSVHAVVVDLYDPSLFGERSRTYRDSPAPIPKIAGALEIISVGNSVLAEKTDDANTFTFKFNIVDSPEIQRTITYIRDDFKKPEVIQRIIDIAGDRKIRAMVHGSATGGYVNKNLKRLIREVKQNRGVIINENLRLNLDSGENAITEGPNKYSIEKLKKFYRCEQDQDCSEASWFNSDATFKSLVIDFQN